MAFCVYAAIYTLRKLSRSTGALKRHSFLELKIIHAIERNFLYMILSNPIYTPTIFLKPIEDMHTGSSNPVPNTRYITEQEGQHSLTSFESRLVPSRYSCVLGLREDWGLGWGARGGSHGKGRRKNSDWQISFAGIFLKGNGTFLVFFFLLNILSDVYLFIINYKKVSKKYFYAFSGVLVVSPAWLVRGKLRIPGKAWTISMVLFIVNCGLKVGNSFLHIFSRFLSFTEIDFLCLYFFSFTCAWDNRSTRSRVR